MKYKTEKLRDWQVKRVITAIITVFICLSYYLLMIQNVSKVGIIEIYNLCGKKII